MAERPRVYYAYGSAVSGATHLVWHSEANDADVPAPDGDYVRESDYADLEAERDEWQDMCTEAQAQLSAARSERDEWKRRAEKAERLLDIADDHASASLAEYAASDAYYRDLLQRAADALDKSVVMAGVYDSEVDATIAEIREYLGEEA